MKFAVAWLLALGASVPAAIAGQIPFTAGAKSPSHALLSPELVDRIEALRLRWDIRGISVALAGSPEFNEGRGLDASWITETAGFGIADRKNNRVDDQTLFSIASNSKLFTMLSVGMLVENQTALANGDTLKWTTKIKDLLPEWKLMDEYASDHANLIDLGSMRSGMPRHDLATGYHSASDLVARMRHFRPSTELRQGWQYNNHHYVTLALIVERLSGMPLPMFVQRHILDPLGMDQTTYSNSVAEDSGHRSDGFARVHVNLTECRLGLEKDPVEIGPGCTGHSGSLGWWAKGEAGGEAGPGGVISSAHDMATWLQELLDPQVISPALLQRLTTGIMASNGVAKWPEYGVANYGLAQIIMTYRGHAVHMHGGAVPGQHTQVLRLPDLGLGVFVAINDETFGPLGHEIIGNMIIDDILGLDPIDHERRIVQAAMSLPTPPTPPSNPRAYPLDPQGRYYDPGYGQLDVKVLRKPDVPVWIRDSAAQGKPLNVSGPVYGASLTVPWVANLIFTHFDGPLFNWTGLYVADELDADDKVVGQMGSAAMSGTAVFTPIGLGLFGDFWGKGQAVEPRQVDESDPKRTAEVWYERVFPDTP